MVRTAANATFSIPSTINPFYDAEQIELHCIMLIFIVGMFSIRMPPHSIYYVEKSGISHVTSASHHISHY
jgi:hypothetical protein